MNPQTFFERLNENLRPVVVDFWAPWCGPCRAVKPNLEKLAQKYVGRVDLWEVNADESQELLRQLRSYGIPTLIGYNRDEEKVRYVGAKPLSQMKSLFEALSNGTVPVSPGLSGWDRLIRLLAGSALAGIAGARWHSHVQRSIRPLSDLESNYKSTPESHGEVAILFSIASRSIHANLRIPLQRLWNGI